MIRFVSRRSPGPRVRRRSAHFAAVLIAVVGVAMTVGACGDGSSRLTGTDLGKQASPNFELTGFRGEPVRLSDLKGKAVVVTFIYTHCPDVCPLTAENLRYTASLLSNETISKVEFVAITVDPDRDTMDALRDFSELHGLADNPQWHAVSGDRSVLEAVWRVYGIDPGASATLSHAVHVAGTPAALATHQASAAESLFLHTDAIFVIDPQGRQRLFLRSDFDPEALAKDLDTIT